jgi:hypothetical protein
MFDSLVSRQTLLHSSHQIDFLIVGRAGGTLWGCYQQAVRECHKRFEALAAALSQMEYSVGSLKASGLPHVPPVCQESSRNLMRIIERYRISATRDAARELLRFLAHVVVLRRKLGPLDNNQRELLEVDLWTHRAQMAMARDLLQYGRPTGETLDLVATLPVVLRVELLRTTRDHGYRNRLLNWFACYRSPVEDVTPVIRRIHNLSLGQAIARLSHEWGSAESELELEADPTAESQGSTSAAAVPVSRHGLSYASENMQHSAYGAKLGRITDATKAVIGGAIG